MKMRASLGLVAAACICVTINAAPATAMDEPDFSQPYAVYASMRSIAEECLAVGNNACSIVCQEMQKVVTDIYSSYTGSAYISRSANLPQIAPQMQQLWENCRQRL